MKLTDMQLAETVNAYMAAHPYATRKQISNACGASRERIGRLHSEGMVREWPEPLTRRIAGSLNSKKSCWHNYRSLK